MPHILVHHHSTITLPCSISRSTPLIRPLASVDLRCPRPQLTITTTTGGGSGNGGRGTIICMANPRRVNMVAKQIMREISDMLLKDKVLQQAVLPEAALGADRYLSSVTTVSDVEVSGDLQVVKVYVTVFGDERGKEVALAGLKSKAKYVRSMLGKRMKLRRTPDIRFIEDESVAKANRILDILDEIKEEREREAAESQDPDSQESVDESNDDAEWEEEDDDDDDDDDDDVGIIYVK